MNSVRVLSLHAGYRCRHAGACCTSGWPIPVERDTLHHLGDAIDERLVEFAAPPGQSPFVHLPHAPDETPAVLATTGGRCVFYRPSADGSCAIHARLGHRALPLACRQFPRLSVIDPRGVSVTLSHYCPTAAALLETDAPVHIVVDTPAFPPEGEYIGLDATGTLPPLLRPGVLMDWESWWEFERLSVEMLGASSSPWHALGTLRAIVDDVREWSPGDGSLGDRIADAFARERRASARPGAAPCREEEMVAIVLGAVPEPLRPLAEWRERASTAPGMSARFLAAHAFANWTTHLGQGLRTWLRTVEVAAALLDAGAGVRHADLLLRHLTEPRAFAQGAASAEGD